jgi:hypothetical protein
MSIYHSLAIPLIYAVGAWAQADLPATRSHVPAISEDSTEIAEPADTATMHGSEDTADTARAIAHDMPAEAGADSAAHIGGTASDTTAAAQQDSAFYPEGNPFMALGASSEEEVVADSADGARLLIDISRGVTLSSLRAEPAYLDMAAKRGFVCDLGLRVPLRKWLLIGVAVRYFEVAFSIEDTYVGLDNEVSTTTRETMSFVSLPIEITAIFDLHRILPYISIIAEPALFTAGYFYAKERAVTTFSDRSTLVTERSYDQDISKDRERYHGFAGAGAGLEIPYGFASIYIQGSCLIGLRDIGTGNTRPLRTESRLFYFPLSLGLRFSL